MANVDLSYARDVLSYRFGGDDDWNEAEACLSVYSRPVCRAKTGLESLPELPDVHFCMHWGVKVEFKQSSKGLGRCIYTFDADAQKKGDLCKTDFTELLKALMAGEFMVTGFEYYPDQKDSKYATKHPYEEELIHREDCVFGLISPAKMLAIVRQSAKEYTTRTYNFVFNNCQDVANNLSVQISRSIKPLDSNSSSNQSSKMGKYWTAGDAALAGAATAVGIGGLIWGAFKLFGSSREQEVDEDDDEASAQQQQRRVKQSGRV